MVELQGATDRLIINLLGRGHVLRPVSARDLPVRPRAAVNLHRQRRRGVARLANAYVVVLEAEHTWMIVVKDQYTRHIGSWSVAALSREPHRTPAVGRDGEVELEILRFLVLGVLHYDNAHRFACLVAVEGDVRVDRHVVAPSLRGAVNSLDVHSARAGEVTRPRNHAVHLPIRLVDHVEDAAMLDAAWNRIVPGYGLIVRDLHKCLHTRDCCADTLLSLHRRKRQRLPPEHVASGLHAPLRPGRPGIELVMDQILDEVRHVLALAVLPPYLHHHLCLLLRSGVPGEDQLGARSPPVSAQDACVCSIRKPNKSWEK
mmetsp:Transcript_28885/g.75607  ORF Transcript_28885/g.75607 Transcript_28885/m.75607 type:complete len:316 (-) Transcript_28885:709-1656(-)